MPFKATVNNLVYIGFVLDLYFVCVFICSSNIWSFLNSILHDFCYTVRFLIRAQ